MDKRIKGLDKKDAIIIFLKSIQTASTGRISSVIKSDMYRTNQLLKELYDQKKIKKIEMPNATYWELR